MFNYNMIIVFLFSRPNEVEDDLRNSIITDQIAISIVTDVRGYTVFNTHHLHAI